MKKIIFFVAIMLFIGCGMDNNANIEPVGTQKTKVIIKKVPCIIDNTAKSNTQNKQNNPCVIVLKATGEGITPNQGVSNMAQAKVMARRAAIIDGYKVLAEKMYGIKINGKDSVKDMMVQNSEVRTYVEGLIRGAKIDKESFKDGIYTVIMSVKLDTEKWNKFINNN